MKKNLSKDQQTVGKEVYAFHVRISRRYLITSESQFLNSLVFSCRQVSLPTGSELLLDSDSAVALPPCQKTLGWVLRIWIYY